MTELMAGVKAPPRTVQLFQLMCWPMGHKVPTSTNSLVELMNMVEKWRQRTDYGPVCIVSPYVCVFFFSLKVLIKPFTGMVEVGVEFIVRQTPALSKLFNMEKSIFFRLFVLLEGTDHN